MQQIPRWDARRPDARLLAWQSLLRAIMGGPSRCRCRPSHGAPALSDSHAGARTDSVLGMPTTPVHAITAAAVAALCLALAACTTTAPATGTANGQAAGGSPATAAPAGGVVTAAGRGWTPAGLDGPISAPGTCRIRWTAAKQPLPDPKCTPGARDSAVTPSTLAATVCRRGGYTASVRPPVSLTDAAKAKIMAAYGIPASEASKYELDHLIPLDAGGASDVRNLWPEPNTFAEFTKSEYVHNDKDQIESDAQHAICSRTAGLDALQRAFAADWTTIRLPHESAGTSG